MSERHPSQRQMQFPAPQRTGIFLLLVLLAAELAGILIISHNHFFYTLDDPYIHLSLAEHIARGHYGINAGEYSAPSSSIIWPFLLAPFVSTAVFTMIPLLFNIAAAFGSVLLFGVLSGYLVPPDIRNRTAVQSVLVLLLCICTNLVGLVFTGMEHSLQLLCTLLIVNGLFAEIRTGRVHWSVWMAIAAAPLVRYECVAISLAAAVFLFLRGHRVAASLFLSTAVAALLLFSRFLMSMGLSPFPSSVMAKSAVVAGGHGTALVGGIFSTLASAFTSSRGLLLAMTAGALGFACFLKNTARADRLLAACMAGAVVLHLLVGRYGSYNRYEVYIWSAGLLTILHVLRGPVAAIVFTTSSRYYFIRPVVSAAGLLLACYPYVIGLTTIPSASDNIYKQQFQMRRFAVRYYKQPVGVNDIGLVSYRNPAYVLDYAGLASETSLAHAQSGGGEWMDSLARRHNVHFAMIYREWFKPVPAGWISVGELVLDGPLITPAGRSVTFFATDSLTYRNVMPLIDDFASSLPSAVRFVRSGGREDMRFGNLRFFNESYMAVARDDGVSVFHPVE